MSLLLNNYGYKTKVNTTLHIKKEVKTIATITLMLGDSEFNGRKIDLVRELSILALQKMEATTPSNTKKADEIYEKALSLYSEIEEYISLHVMKTYLSYISHEEYCVVTKLTGQHGYFLKEKTYGI